MNANEDMIAYSRYKQIGDENLFLMEKVRQQQAEIEALKDIMVVAIKAGDWIVDGACDPDQYIGDRL